MSKRCGIINGCYVMMDRAFNPNMDSGTIFTNLSEGELCIVMAGEKKLIRVDAGTGVDNIQRIITKVDKDENDNIVVYYRDLTIVDGIATEISDENSYIVEL